MICLYDLTNILFPGLTFSEKLKFETIKAIIENIIVVTNKNFLKYLHVKKVINKKQNNRKKSFFHQTNKQLILLMQLKLRKQYLNYYH